MKEDHRIAMSLSEFNGIEVYEDEEYLMFNYEEQLIHPAFRKINNPKGAKELFSELTKGQQALWTLAELGGQVYNGGLAQYFWNSQGEFANEAVRGLELIGDNTVLPEFRKAIEKAKAPELLPLRRSNTFAPYAQALDLIVFDDLYFSNSTELQRKMIAYLKSHPEEFILV